MSALVPREQLAAPIAPLAEEYIAVLVLSLAGRLNRGASGFYLRHFDIEEMGRVQAHALDMSTISWNMP